MCVLVIISCYIQSNDGFFCVFSQHHVWQSVWKLEMHCWVARCRKIHWGFEVFVKLAFPSRLVHRSRFTPSCIYFINIECHYFALSTFMISCALVYLHCASSIQDQPCNKTLVFFCVSALMLLCIRNGFLFQKIKVESLDLKLLCAFKLKQDNNTFLHAASHKTVRNHCWHIHKGYMHFTGYWMYWMYSTLSLIDLLQCISVETRPQPFSMKLLYTPDPVGLMRRRSLH